MRRPPPLVLEHADLWRFIASDMQLRAGAGVGPGGDLVREYKRHGLEYRGVVHTGGKIRRYVDERGELINFASYSRLDRVGPARPERERIPPPGRRRLTRAQRRRG